ncbi:hypothetical protein Nmel_018678 [Mimus melanotis]
MGSTSSKLTDPMAVPPSYSDLGKSARDVFNKGYGFGMVKLELKTKSSTGVVSIGGFQHQQHSNGRTNS